MRVNYDNMSANIKYLTKEKPMIAVVKDDAYNCGLLETVSACITSGVNWFMVTNINDALFIKNINQNLRVIVWNKLSTEDVIKIIGKDIDVLCHDFEYYKSNRKYLEQIKSLHLHINVGMNRFGVCDTHEILSLSKLNNVVGLCTHFSTADETDLSSYTKQVEFFSKVHNMIKKDKQFEIIHASNSASFTHGDKELDFTTHNRIGIMLYGYHPYSFDKNLLPTIFEEATIIDVKFIKKDTLIGYGLTNKAYKGSYIAIADKGYGSGIPKRRKEVTVTINKKQYSFASDISMSHMFLDVDQSVKIGDKVEIFGYKHRIDTVKQKLNMVNSELMCTLRRENDR